MRKPLRNPSAAKVNLITEIVNSSIFDVKGDARERLINEMLYGQPYTHLEMKIGEAAAKALTESKLWELVK